MKKLRVLAEARREFADALRWYRRQAPAFAEALALEYRQIVRHAQEFPDAGAVEAALQSMTVRRYLLHQFPYKVLTVHLDDQIVGAPFRRMLWAPLGLIGWLQSRLRGKAVHVDGVRTTRV